MARPDGSAAVDERSSRAALLTTGAVGIGSALLAGLAGARTATAVAAPSKQQDVAILNYALLLEYLQAEFYEKGLARASLRGELREFAEVVGDHERQHVDFLRKTLGAAADKKPTFSFGETVRNREKFAQTAVVLEDAGVLAYNGEASNLTRPSLAAAAAIVSVEGRHAAWIRDLVGVAPAPRAADAGQAARAVIEQLRAMKLLGHRG